MEFSTDGGKTWQKWTQPEQKECPCLVCTIRRGGEIIIDEMTFAVSVDDDQKCLLKGEGWKSNDGWLRPTQAE